MALRSKSMNQADNTGLRSTVGQAIMLSKKAFWGIGFFSFFVNLLMLTGPIYMLQVYDRVLTSRSNETLLIISVLMLLLYAFMGFFDFCRSRVLVRVANKFEQTMGDRTFKIWLKQGLMGKAAARHAPLNDVSTIRQFLSGPAPGTFFDIPWAPVFIASIFILHWTLGLLAIAGTIVIIISALYNEWGTRKPMLESLKLRRAEQALAQQSHRNADAIEAMGMGSNMRARWRELSQKGAEEGLVSSDRSGSSTAFSKSFRMFIQSAILGMGGYLAVKQIITPGAMIAGSIILGRALAPIQMVIGQWRGFNAARDAYSRLNAFYEIMPEDKDNLQLPPPTGALSVEQVTAGPPGAQAAILAGINFKLNPGQGLGIIGPSASGKSTLARLLVGNWIPQKGAIRLDGATFDQWDRDEIGKYIGYLPQEVELFDGTIGENIARFNAAASAEDIVQAAKWAGVHDLILRLPEGYKTRIGEGGAVLSGGQTQRIALARALYGDPCLIVLDEPNASLDAEGDAALTRAIAGARQRGKTVVVMAHRPSAIVAVDQLLMLQDGRQTAFGPKEEVLKDVMKSRSQPSDAKPKSDSDKVISLPNPIKPKAKKAEPAEPAKPAEKGRSNKPPRAPMDVVKGK